MSDGQVHSRFGGSSADRWMNCAGSVALCATVPPAPSSIYATEGTRAHALAQHCLENGMRSAVQAVAAMTAAELGVLGYSIETCEAVQVYLDAVWRELEAASDAELFVEQKFTFPGMNGEVFGRNDAIVYSASRKRLVVFDYKHGQGVSVTAEDNAQLKFYASGALLANPEWKVSEIELIIVQPRARDADEIGAIRPWPMDLLEVINFSADVDEAVRSAATPGADLKTGDWCRWCPAAAICPAKEREALTALQVGFDGVEQVDVTELPEPAQLGDRLGAVLSAVEILTAWANQVREFAEEHMLAGTIEVPGWKVVQKVGRAKWIASDPEILGYLGMMWGLDENDVAPRKLIGFTDMRKTLKAAGASGEQIGEFEARYTSKESSGLTIAPARDRRPAVTPGSQFDGVSIEEK